MTDITASLSQNNHQSHSVTDIACTEALTRTHSHAISSSSTPSNPSRSSSRHTTPPPHAPEPSDLPALVRTHHTSGYRDGIAAGKGDPATVQAGFDAGWIFGAAAGMRTGFLLGAMRGAIGEGGVASDGTAEKLERMERELSAGAFVARSEIMEFVRRIEGMAGGQIVGEEESEINVERGSARRSRVEELVASLEAVQTWESEVEAIGKSKGIDMRWSCTESENGNTTNVSRITEHLHGEYATDSST